MRLKDRFRAFKGASVLLSYIFPLSVTCGIAVVQMKLAAVEAPLFAMFFWSILTTRIFGQGPGALSAVLATALGNFLFLGQVGMFSFDGHAGYWSVLFMAMALATVFMVAGTQRYNAMMQVLLVQEKKIAQRNEDLAAALKNAVKTRDAFLAIAGHELKTPVTALVLNAQAWKRRLLRPNKPQSPADVLKGWERQNQSLQRLNILVEQLLDVSRINTGRLELNVEEVNLHHVVEEVAMRLFEQDAKSDSKLTIEPASRHVVGQWDRMRIEQVIGNLLSNALKYGRGQPVSVKVKDRGETALLVVKDQGQGISEADKARIFDCFERVNSDGTIGGLGLGLWIVKQIVEATGGNIAVQSLLGEGSEFTVVLPKAAPGVAAKAAPMA